MQEGQKPKGPPVWKVKLAKRVAEKEGEKNCKVLRADNDKN